MRSTLVTLALALVFLSASRADAANRVVKVVRASYACSDAIMTQRFYDLAGIGTHESRLEMDSFMSDARHAEPRLCRWFNPGTADVVIPDTGDGFTCLTKAADGQHDDKFCYWAVSRNIQ